MLNKKQSLKFEEEIKGTQKRSTIKRMMTKVPMMMSQ